MKLDRRGAARGLLVMLAALAMAVTKSHDDPAAMSASVDPPLKSKRAIRPAPGTSRNFRKNDEKDALPFIRSQFVVLLSDHPELASLDETLAACDCGRDRRCRRPPAQIRT